MRLLWLDLHSSYAHSSLALPAIHALVEGREGGVEWAKVAATINSNVGSVVAGEGFVTGMHDYIRGTRNAGG